MNYKKDDIYAVVIGAANIDIGGHPYDSLISRDSNPGYVSISYGGVARNIAHNLAGLGINVKLIAAVGCDLLGDGLIRYCKENSIDMSHVIRDPGGNSSVYMYINDADGDMALALSYIDICELITPDYIDSVKDVIKGASVAVCDANITYDTFIHLKDVCSAYNVPLYMDPVSQPHCRKIKGHLSGIDTLKPNRLEAEYLTDISTADEAGCILAAREIISQGVGRVFISMSDKGLIAADSSEIIKVDIIPVDVVCTTGAGDSAMAAITWASVHGYSKEYAARAAVAAAALTIQVQETNNPHLTSSALTRMLQL